jgi:hypothetical protein
MFTAPGTCPVCGGELVVTRLHCPGCQTVLEGQFALGRFARLSPEQLQFLETFLRCRGVLRDVEAALGLSYPTVRSRLDDLLRALGLDGDDRPREAQRRAVLEALRAGQIDPDEAARRLRDLSR